MQAWGICLYRHRQSVHTYIPCQKTYARGYPLRALALLAQGSRIGKTSRLPPAISSCRDCNLQDYWLLWRKNPSGCFDAQEIYTMKTRPILSLMCCLLLAVAYWPEYCPDAAAMVLDTVSYTHLTLPTKRIV